MTNLIERERQHGERRVLRALCYPRDKVQTQKALSYGILRGKDLALPTRLVQAQCHTLFAGETRVLAASSLPVCLGGYR